MEHLHSDLAAGRWFSLTLAEQLGNVGSEYERAQRSLQRKDHGHFEKAFERLLELLDLTIADERWQNHRLRELTRLREAVCDELLAGYASSNGNDLKNYFLYFGLLARRDR